MPDKNASPFMAYSYWAATITEKDRSTVEKRLALASLQNSLFAAMEAHCEDRWREAYARIPWWQFSRRKTFRANRDLWIDADYDRLWSESFEADWTKEKENESDTEAQRQDDGEPSA